MVNAGYISSTNSKPKPLKDSVAEFQVGVVSVPIREDAGAQRLGGSFPQSLPVGLYLFLEFWRLR